MRRSTFYDEDLGEVVDLSGHGDHPGFGGGAVSSPDDVEGSRGPHGNHRRLRKIGVQAYQSGCNI